MEMSAYVSSHYGILVVKVQIDFFSLLTTTSHVESTTYQCSEVMKESVFYGQAAVHMLGCYRGCMNNSA